MTPEQEQQIQVIINKTNAILDEADVTAKTGRTRADVGRVPAGAPITRLIDHTLLKANATAREVEQLCLEAKQHHFASVCVNSVFVPLANQLLSGSDVAVCTVVGFPLGACLPQVKAYEAYEAIRHGATEIDMVLHVGALKNRDLVSLFDELSDVAVACHDQDALCKVILETALLTEEEIIIACQIAKRAGMDFVKTSTGFSSGGATAEHIALMRYVVGEGMGVKASGGVRTLEDARNMVKAGANRLGASAGVAIARAEAGETTHKDATSTEY